MKALAAVLTVVAALALFGVIPVSAGDGRGVAPRIRFTNDRIAEAVRFAAERSASFREEIAALEASDSVVYIVDGKCRAELRSCLHLLPFVGERRMVISVNPRQPLMSVAGSLAHELRHAVEIVSTRDVVDTESLRRLYKRIGFQSCGPTPLECWETQQAQDTERRVEREARAWRAAVGAATSHGSAR